MKTKGESERRRRAKVGEGGGKTKGKDRYIEGESGQERRVK